MKITRAYIDEPKPGCCEECDFYWAPVDARYCDLGAEDYEHCPLIYAPSKSVMRRLDVQMPLDIAPAIRRAFNIFDGWNDTTGLVQRGSANYCEIRCIIDDAVNCGVQEALGKNIELDSEMQLKRGEE